MVTFTNRNGVALSAHAVLNGAPMPAAIAFTTPGAGDFAERQDGRARRAERRARIAGKRAFLFS
jgi:hypothetical protein